MILSYRSMYVDQLSNAVERRTMKRSFKILIGAFAAIGVVSTGAMLTTQVFAQGKSEKTVQSGWVRPTKPILKISPIEALTIATKKLNGGTAFQAIYEFDEGHWVYGVLVVKGHTVTEVSVDPMTGKVLDTEALTADDEAKEARDLMNQVIKAGG